jgi:hypothetical protein
MAAAGMLIKLRFVVADCAAGLPSMTLRPDALKLGPCVRDDDCV